MNLLPKKFRNTQDDDENFMVFISHLEKRLRRYPKFKNDLDLQALQKTQLETLVSFEREFTDLLISLGQFDLVIQELLFLSKGRRKNLLALRPFFRERQTTFSATIAHDLKEISYDDLTKYSYNYNLANFTKKFLEPQGLWTAKHQEVFDRICKMRNEIAEMNIPLVLSRARLFWSHVPRAQLDYLDIVEIAIEGLMMAIDKYCLPYTSAFRAVIIGRSLGCMIDRYSRTLVSFSPSEKKKIYKANKYRARMLKEDSDFDIIADKINNEEDCSDKTTGEEIRDLLNAVSYISASQAGPDGPYIEPVNSILCQETYQPDVAAEQKELLDILSDIWNNHLSIFEKKILKLKGINLEG